MISSDSRIVSGLRRISTPNAPVPKRAPATPRYHVISGPRTPLPLDERVGLPGVAAEHDAADGRDEQHDRRDLERDQVVGQEQPADVGGAAERARDVGLVREPAAGGQAD